MRETKLKLYQTCLSIDYSRYQVLSGFVKNGDTEVAEAEKLKESGVTKEKERKKWGQEAPFCSGIPINLQMAK